MRSHNTSSSGTSSNEMEEEELPPCFEIFDEAPPRSGHQPVRPLRTREPPEPLAQRRVEQSQSEDIEYLNFFNFNTTKERHQKEYDFCQEQRLQEMEVTQPQMEDGNWGEAISQKEHELLQDEQYQHDLLKEEGMEIEKDWEWEEKHEETAGQFYTKEAKNSMYMEENGRKPDKKHDLNRQYCNCSKTMCTKNYCPCFSKGLRCNSWCNCKNCLNCKMEGNSSDESMDEIRERKLSKRKEDECCNCVRSFCEKSYCACWKSGVGCSERCSCFNCKNKFGRNSRR